MARSDPHSLRPKHQKSAGDADQTELAALRLGTAIVGAGSYDDRVASALDDFTADGHETEEWAQEDLTSDSAVGSIHEEIERRKILLGDAYPFNLSNGSLSYQASPTRTYEFLLAAATATSLTAGDFKKLPRAFERLSCDLIALWLGGSTAVHTGWPRDRSVGSNFSAAMQYVCQTFEEPHWKPQEHLPSNPGRGDHGLDFVIRKVAPDKRSIGQLFVLGQCACGNDWTSKFEDLSLDRLRKWFHPFSHVPPVRAFATPHHVVDGWLYEASERAGLIFDRARLTAIASSPEAAPVVVQYNSDFNALINLVLSTGAGTTIAA